MKCAAAPGMFESDGGIAAPNSKRFGVTAALSFLYLLAALACLIQYGTPHLSARVDLFSGGYLVFRSLGAVHSVISGRRAFGSNLRRREWWGLTSNPRAKNWVILLMVGDLGVFLDYGHCHLVPSLQRPAWQSLGLALYILAAAWQVWTDSYLARYFGSDRPDPAPLSEGPFRHIRHPRYAAAIAAKMALALVFASVLGWLLWLAWIVLLLRNVRVEEAHLRTLFGARYEAYAEGTARLLPGIY